MWNYKNVCNYVVNSSSYTHSFLFLPSSHWLSRFLHYPSPPFIFLLLQSRLNEFAYYGLQRLTLFLRMFVHKNFPRQSSLSENALSSRSYSLGPIIGNNNSFSNSVSSCGFISSVSFLHARFHEIVILPVSRLAQSVQPASFEAVPDAGTWRVCV